MLYIGTSTQFQLRFVNQDALDQTVGNNRVDATLNNASILPRKSGELEMNPTNGNTIMKRPAANNDY